MGTLPRPMPPESVAVRGPQRPLVCRTVTRKTAINVFQLGGPPPCMSQASITSQRSCRLQSGLLFTECLWNINTCCASLDSYAVSRAFMLLPGSDQISRQTWWDVSRCCSRQSPSSCIKSDRVARECPVGAGHHSLSEMQRTTTTHDNTRGCRAEADLVRDSWAQRLARPDHCSASRKS